MRKIEILAPAGSYESLQAAINASCDAVYIGGNQFGARAYANNLNEDMLLQAIDYAHIHDKSLYLTINTLLKEQELNRELYKYIVKYYERGLDAVIVQDPGVLHFIHRNFPDLPIHASTQMTLTMAEGANVLKEYGVTRIVTSRELSFDEVKNIRANTDLEIEAFVHGALCYCYSGQCLMSSMIGGRSGNRGRCAQPCRMPYELYGSGKKLSNGQERHLLSPKDMCTLHLIPVLIESGIDSFKIEGRMKRPEYTALASHLYRKYVDLYCKLGKEEYERYLERNDQEFSQDIMDLMDLYNRGSFTQGYYVSHNGKKMMSMSRPNHNGVFVGKVSSVKGNNATIQLVEDIHAQDILEIRISDAGVGNSTSNQVPNKNSKYTGKNSSNQRDSVKKYSVREEHQVNCISQTKEFTQDFDKSYEFTVKEEGRKGTTMRTNFFAKSKVAAGQEVYRTRNQALLTRLEEAFLKEERKVEITGHFSAKAGQPMRLTLQYAHSRETYTIHVTGDSPELAQNQSATSEQVMKQLRKTNATHFTYKALDIELDDGLFIPNGKLNDLRREAVERLEEEIAQSYSRSERERQFSSTFNGTEVVGEKKQAQNAPSIRVRLDDIRLLDTMLTYQVIEAIYLNCEEISFDQITTASSKVRSAGKRFYLVLPHVFRKGVMEQFNGDLMNRMLSSIDGIVIRNLEEYAFFTEYVKKYDLEVILDSNMYVINNEARAFWEEQGITRYTASVELNSQELSELNLKSADIIVYGHLALMVSAQCVLNNTVGCIKNRKESIPSRNMYYELRDGKQKVFYVRNHCGYCYNTIYNGSPLYLFSHATEIKRLNPHSIRLDFTLEETEEARKVMEACIRSFSDQEHKQMESYQPSNMTKGHFNRGIE